MLITPKGITSVSCLFKYCVNLNEKILGMLMDMKAKGVTAEDQEDPKVNKFVSTFRPINSNHDIDLMFAEDKNKEMRLGALAKIFKRCAVVPDINEAAFVRKVIKTIFTDGYIMTHIWVKENSK